MSELLASPSLMFESERLLFRAFTAEDFEDLKALHQHPDVAASTFTGFSDDARVQAELGEYIEEFQRLGMSQLHVSELEMRRFIGRMGFQHRQWNPEIPEKEFELRFAIHPDFWSQGYATEGSKALIRYAFEEMKLPKIVMAHFVENVKSEIISQKLGFQKTHEFAVKDRLIIGYEQRNPNTHSLI